MKTILPLLATASLLTLSCSAFARHRSEHTAAYVQYKGAWFTIEYPAGWTARPSLMESQPAGGPVSVFFTAPDKSVEFYVFSPQWNGRPKDIAQDPNREILVSQQVESAPRDRNTDGSYLYNPVAHWYTASAKDHSYQRSWVDVEDKGLGVRHVFGIQYRNAQTYQKYRMQYRHFCKSLVQFSD